MGEGEADVWRDSLVRYLGYANELGESFRPLAPRLVAPSYFVALAYVAGDTLDKAHRAREKFEAASERRRAAEVANAAGDTLLWQTSASVVIPGFTINRVVALSAYLVERGAKNSPVLRRWAPTVIGLGVIPFIVHPIDALVDSVMDRSTRVWAADLMKRLDD